MHCPLGGQDPRPSGLRRIRGDIQLDDGAYEGQKVSRSMLFQEDEDEDEEDEDEDEDEDDEDMSAGFEDSEDADSDPEEVTAL